MLDQTTDYVYANCFIERVSTEDLKTPRRTSRACNGGSLPSKMDGGGVARPLSPIFEAVVPLPTEEADKLLRIGLVGRENHHRPAHASGAGCIGTSRIQSTSSCKNCPSARAKNLVAVEDCS